MCQPKSAARLYQCDETADCLDKRIAKNSLVKMIETVLFDFDGVIFDTEPQYDIFWNRQGLFYFGDSDFAKKLKGRTLKNIFEEYFAGISAEEINKCEKSLADFESKMSFPQVPGALDFIRLIKERSYKAGLVTSSPPKKIERALSQTGIGKYFDTIVTSHDVEFGKPNPQCYLLGASRLNSLPRNCAVFEDAITGIMAGKAAEMYVVGVSSSLSPDLLRPIADAVITDFSNPGSVIKILEAGR